MDNGGVIQTTMFERLPETFISSLSRPYGGFEVDLCYDNPYDRLETRPKRGRP